MTKRKKDYLNELIGEKYENPELLEKGTVRVLNDDLTLYKTKSHPLYKVFSKKQNGWLQWKGKDLLALTFSVNKWNESFSIRIRTEDGSLKYVIFDKFCNLFEYKGQSCFRQLGQVDEIGGRKIYLEKNKKIYLQPNGNIYQGKEFEEVYYDKKAQEMFCVEF